MLGTGGDIDTGAMYLRAFLRINSDWSRGIGLRITKAEKASLALTKFLKSKLLKKKTKKQNKTIYSENKSYTNLWLQSVDYN